jgi:excisionase family DNA binding protein
MSGDEALLNVKEAAQRLGIAPNTLRKWSNEGQIETVRLPSGHRRYEPAVIQDKRRELGFRDGEAQP